MKRTKPYERRHKKQRLRRAAAKKNGEKTGDEKADGTVGEKPAGEDVSFHLVPLLFHHEKPMIKQIVMD